LILEEKHYSSDFDTEGTKSLSSSAVPTKPVIITANEESSNSNKTFGKRDIAFYSTICFVFARDKPLFRIVSRTIRIIITDWRCEAKNGGVKAGCVIIQWRC
jgi:hypothetical protein